MTAVIPQCNRLQAGRTKHPTLTDVAHSAGVSTATVSPVINHPNAVSPLLRNRILSEIDAIGYVPHGVARALASQRTHTVGAIIPTLSNAIFATGLQAFEQRLDAAGFTLLVAISEYDPDHALRHTRSLISRGVDGLMLVGQSHHDDIFNLLHSQGVPYVTTWSYRPDGPHPCVGFDNHFAAHRLTSYLLEIGHRRIAMIGGISRHNDRARNRIFGVQQALQAWDVPFPEGYLLERRYDIGEGREALNLLLRHAEPPSAIICGNDVLAMGALFEAQAMGINIPDDLSVAGFDNLPLVAHLSPPLTTMAVPSEQMGRKAAEFLLARFADKPVVEKLNLEVELIVRATTSAPKK